MEEMKKLKFKGWAKKDKTLFPVVTIDWEKYIVRTLEGNLDTHNYYIYKWDLEDVNLIQYTGLKDKHGKEIYESDIVEADWGYGCPRIAVELESLYYAKGECSISEEIEVIGNIYENPELLKEKK